MYSIRRRRCRRPRLSRCGLVCDAPALLLSAFGPSRGRRSLCRAAGLGCAPKRKTRQPRRANGFSIAPASRGTRHQSAMANRTAILIEARLPLTNTLIEGRPRPPRCCPRNIQSPPELVSELLIGARHAWRQRCRSAPQPQVAQSDGRRPQCPPAIVVTYRFSEPPKAVLAAVVDGTRTLARSHHSPPEPHMKLINERAYADPEAAARKTI
jgi:hypothetical protein